MENRNLYDLLNWLMVAGFCFPLGIIAVWSGLKLRAALEVAR